MNELLEVLWGRIRAAIDDKIASAASNATRAEDAADRAESAVNGDVTASQITDSTVVGRSVLTAATAPAARTAIGAGTSNLTLGTTASTAKAGNYQPAWGDITDTPTTFTPATHAHTVTDITATGTRSATTYLRGDGAWVTPTNTTYSVPTQAEAEAGTATTGRVFSAQRVAQAIAAKTAPIMAAINARPAMFLWDGSGTYAVPANAVPGVDNVLNLATGEIHTITA